MYSAGQRGSFIEHKSDVAFARQNKFSQLARRPTSQVKQALLHPWPTHLTLCSHDEDLTWRKGLLELLCLLLVCDDQCVQVPAAAHLEFHIVLVLLDFDG